MQNYLLRSKHDIPYVASITRVYHFLPTHLFQRLQNQWSTDFCDWCAAPGGLGLCCYSAWCPCLLAGDNFERMEPNVGFSMLRCLLYCLLPTHVNSSGSLEMVVCIKQPAHPFTEPRARLFWVQTTYLKSATHARNSLQPQCMYATPTPTWQGVLCGGSWIGAAALYMGTACCFGGPCIPLMMVGEACICWPCMGRAAVLQLHTSAQQPADAMPCYLFRTLARGHALLAATAPTPTLPHTPTLQHAHQHTSTHCHSTSTPQGRTYLRRKFGIPGSEVEDLLLTWCCPL